MQLPVDGGETENESVSSFFLHTKTYKEINKHVQAIMQENTHKQHDVRLELHDARFESICRYVLGNLW